MSQFMQYTFGGLTTGAIFALIALGFTLIFRVSRVMNLAQGQFYAWSALIESSLLAALKVPLWMSLLVAVVATGVLGVVIDYAALRRTRATDISTLLVITLGASTALEGLAQVIWGSNPLSLPAFTGNNTFHFLGASLLPQDIWVVGGLVVVVIALGLFVERTMAGKALTAIAEMPSTVGMLGINVGRFRLLAFFISGAIGGLAGILASPITYISYSSGLPLGLQGFAAAVVGGIGSPLGAVFGGLGLGLAQQYAAGFVSSIYASAVPFAILVVVLIFRSFRQRTAITDGRRARVQFIPFGRPSVVMAIVLGVLMLVTPWTGHEGLESMGITAGIFVLATQGLQLMQGQTGIISIGQGAFMTFGAYATAILTVHLGLSPLLGLLAGVVFSALIALGLGVVTLRLSGYNLAIVTLALAEVVDTVVNGWRGLTQGATGIVGIPTMGSLSTNAFYYLVWALVIVGAIVLYRIDKSELGRALKALRQDEVAAATNGVAVARLKIGVFLIASVFAAVSGSLYAQSISLVTPGTFDPSTSILLLVMVFVGGETSILGPVVGAVVMVALSTVLSGVAEWLSVIQGVLLVSIMVGMPQGIVGAIELYWRPRKAPEPNGSSKEMTA